MSKNENMMVMFAQANSFNQDISNWNTSNVTTTNGMFYNAFQFNQNIGSWNLSKVTNMRSMFQGATSFNGNILSWDTSNVTEMAYMFSGCTDFLQDIRVWNVSSVQVNYPGGGFTGMFEGCTRMLNAFPELATSEGIVEWFASSDGGTFLS